MQKINIVKIANVKSISIFPQMSQNMSVCMCAHVCDPDVFKNQVFHLAKFYI